MMIVRTCLLWYLRLPTKLQAIPFMLCHTLLVCIVVFKAVESMLRVCRLDVNRFTHYGYVMCGGPPVVPS